jgi:hypothetical protein
VSVIVPFIIALLGFSVLVSLVGTFLYLAFIAWELLKDKWLPDEPLKDHDIEEGVTLQHQKRNIQGPNPKRAPPGKNNRLIRA